MKTIHSGEFEVLLLNSSAYASSAILSSSWIIASGMRVLCLWFDPLISRGILARILKAVLALRLLPNSLAMG